MELVLVIPSAVFISQPHQWHLVASAAACAYKMKRSNRYKLICCLHNHTWPAPPQITCDLSLDGAGAGDGIMDVLVVVFVVLGLCDGLTSKVI